ncbi:MAG: hypothetical protein WBW41_01835 [Verrucomicrobiia bacterium]
MPNSATSAYRWRFFRAGGFDQVKLETGADLMNLDQLDQKLWVALACPTTGLEFDPKSAAFIDSDKDGRIRAPELIAAVKWAGSLLKSADELVKGGDELPLAAINDATPEGKQLLSSAKQILANLGKKAAAAIPVEDASDANKIFANTVFNGDGVIIAESAGDDATRAVIADIAACMGIVTDRSGKPGIDQARADAFFAEARAHSDWWKQAEGDAEILPLGEGTSAAAAAVKAVKAKVDDYFTRCRLAAFDARAIGALNREEKEYLAFAAKDLTLTAAEIAGLPLARIEADKPLPLKEGVNPAWAAALATLHSAAVKPLLGDRSSLSEHDWAALTVGLGPYECWSAGKVGVAVEKLGLKRVREILAGQAKETIEALIARDKALEPEATAITNVEKLARFHRDLFTLCVNFVNFKRLYSAEAPAIFQCGTLYLDQRSCSLCLTVEDAGRHAMMAALAGAYLAYCDCVRKSTGEKMSIAAIFSQGDDDNLMIGRNGIFYDRKGRDYDATITKILSNPISLRQAFWAPYKKLVRLVEEQVAKRAAAADADVNANLTATASVTAGTAAAGPQKPMFDPSVIALLSVAVGSLAAAFAGIAAFLGKFAAWQLPIVLAGIMLIVSGPSLILAYINLRKRNLGPILDANGWAVNARAKINVPFGASLTRIAKLPPGSTVDVSDRYAEKSVLWPKVLVFVFVIWWIYAFLNDSEGRLYRWTDGKYGKTPVEVQKALDAKAAEKKGIEDKGKTTVEAGAAAATATNAPAK